MSNYNLDEAGGAESFEFTLGGNQYKMVYPTTEEIEGIQKLPEDQQQQKLLDFILPTTEGAPSIKDALAKVRVPVLRAFGHMLKEEFSVE